RRRCRDTSRSGRSEEPVTHRKENNRSDECREQTCGTRGVRSDAQMKDETARYTADDTDGDVAPDFPKGVVLCAKAKVPARKTAEETPHDEAQHDAFPCKTCAVALRKRSD